MSRCGCGGKAATAATPGRSSCCSRPTRTRRWVPLTTGARLGEIFLEWALRHSQATLGHYFDNARVLFFSGLGNYKLASAMSEYSENLLFADPLLQLGVPKLLTSMDALGLYASGMHQVSDWVPPRVMPGAGS